MKRADPVIRTPQSKAGYNFPYDSFSMAIRARNLCIAHAHISEHNKRKLKRTERKWQKKEVENIQVDRSYDLVNSMHDFKTKMNFRGFDFDGDKLCQHNEIRKVMAAIYGKEDISF